MTINDIDTHANYIKNGSTPTTASSSNNNNNNNNKLNTGGRKFSWVKRLMKNNNTPNTDRYIKPSPSQQHQKRTAVLVPRLLPHPPTTTQLIQFDPSIDPAITTRTGSIQSSSTDLLSRIPVLSLSSQSMVSSSLDEDDSQQSTTATSVLPTTGPGGGTHNNNATHLNQSSNYIHLNTMHNHALLDDSSIVTLASSNRRCRSFDSNTNLSTLGIPPLSIIERQQISLNNGITSPNSPILNGQQSRYSTGTTGGGADSGSIKTHWTLEKHIGEES